MVIRLSETVRPGHEEVISIMDRLRIINHKGKRICVSAMWSINWSLTQDYSYQGFRLRRQILFKFTKRSNVPTMHVLLCFKDLQAWKLRMKLWMNGLCLVKWDDVWAKWDAKEEVYWLIHSQSYIGDGQSFMSQGMYLVTPGRITPVLRGGVTNSLEPSGSSRRMKRFIAPTWWACSNI